MDANVQAFLDELSPELLPVVLALRDVVLEAAPGVAESVVWNCLSYHRPELGGRVKGAVCQIVVRQGRVRLDFIHGARLADPARVLRGKLVSKRFVNIESAAQAARPEIAALIREAATFVPGR